MNKNRIAGFFESEEAGEVRAALSQTAVNFMQEDFINLTFSDDERFGVFFDEDTYRDHIASTDETFGVTTNQEHLAWDILFMRERIEQAIVDIGGL